MSKGMDRKKETKKKPAKTKEEKRAAKAAKTAMTKKADPWTSLSFNSCHSPELGMTAAAVTPDDSAAPEA